MPENSTEEVEQSSDTAQPLEPASITDLPSDGQTVLHENKTYTTVQEGLAYILIPPNAPLLTDPKVQLEGSAPSQSVFYNPIQQYNRDITVLAIRAFGEDYVKAQRQKLAKELAIKRRKHERRKVQRAEPAAQSAGEQGQRSAKKRKLENGTSDSIIEPQKQGNTPTNDVSLSLDSLEDDDLMDEDFLACESSAIQEGVSVSAPGLEQNGGNLDTDAGTETKVEEQQPSVEFKILDALSATGLRALRYAQELEFATAVTANDLSAKAVNSIKLNIKHNRLEEKITTATGNANGHMYGFVGQESRGGPGHKYDVIDIDPYGTAVPFLDAAVQAVSDGGLLCVTCTDTGVFNSVGFSEKTFSLYGGLPIRGDHCHEGGLRLILHAITTAAARYGIAVEPLLSLSIDYYARVFVRVRRSPAEVKFLGSKTAIVYGCDHGCGAWQLQFLARAVESKGKKNSTFYKHGAAQGPTTSPTCDHCGSKTHVSSNICNFAAIHTNLLPQISGPMYAGPLHNPAFVERMLEMLPSLDPKTYKTLDRIEGMLETAREEMELFDEKNLLIKGDNSDPKQKRFSRLNETAIDHHPFYVIPSALARVLHCQAPSIAQVRGALRHAGFQAVRSHAKPGSIKTNAPWSAIWDIMLEWVRQKAPIREGSLKEGMAGFRLMQMHKSTVQDGSNATPSDGNPNASAGAVHENGKLTDTAKLRENGEAAHSNDMGKLEVVFDEHLGRDKETRRLVRYQMNPRANWGPMTRAK
jgi:tRNA (guanine26-N2/guanine27-N2)-dimethyltransferase